MAKASGARSRGVRPSIDRYTKEGHLAKNKRRKAQTYANKHNCIVKVKINGELEEVRPNKVKQEKANGSETGK